MNDNAAMVRAETHAEIIHVRQGLPGDFGEEHMRIVRESFAPTASEAEFQVLWAGAKSRGLDPVRKQIHFVKRWDDMRGCDVWSSQVSIDGFRSIAEATGKYDGQEEPEFSRDPDDDFLIAKVRVYRKDISRAFVGVAMWPEFAQTKKNGDPTYMWKKMPYHMLAKCAEALALRKAFPEQLAGLYTPDEMGSDAHDDEPPSGRGKEATRGERAIAAPPWARPILDAPKAEAAVQAAVRETIAHVDNTGDHARAVARTLEEALARNLDGTQVARWMAIYRRGVEKANAERRAPAATSAEPVSDTAGGTS